MCFRTNTFRKNLQIVYMFSAKPYSAGESIQPHHRPLGGSHFVVPRNKPSHIAFDNVFVPSGLPNYIAVTDRVQPVVFVDADMDDDDDDPLKMRGSIVNTFFVGSITVVGLYMLYSLMKKNR